MSLIGERIGDITILSGNNNSNDFDLAAAIAAALAKGLRGAALSIAAPAVLSGTAILKVQRDDAVFVDLQSGDPPVDITIPQAKAIPFAFMAFRTLRIVSDAGGGEAADRVFEVWVV